jgi:DNA-binding IclR family transcriptional regulator
MKNQSKSASNDLQEKDDWQKNGTGTQAIDRATTILRKVVSEQRNGISLAEMVSHLNVSRPTVYRIASCLERQGFLYRDFESKQYFLGDFFANLSVGTSPHASLRKICSETIRQLALDVEDTVYLIVRIGDDGRCIVCQEGSSGVRIVTIDVGTQRPLGVGAGGLAILSAIENPERNEIILSNVHRYGLFGNLTERQIRHAVTMTRRRQFAINSVQATLGVKSIAQVIRNLGGEPIAALSISSVTHRINGRVNMLSQKLSESARKIEHILAATH